MTGDRPTNPHDLARYRRFVKEHHPDVGGDPAAFVAGIATHWSPGRGADRYDAPVVIVPKYYRIRRLPGRLWQRLRRSRGPRVR